MPRRAVTFAIAALLVFGLVLGGALLPVPYVALQPGPTKNVLSESNNKPLISVEGHRVYPASGHLNLVTVAYQGGPGFRLDLFTALRGWMDPQVAVVPERTLFPEGQTQKDVEQITSAKMRRSQETATVAALHQLEIPVRQKITIQRVLNDYPANGILERGDTLLAVEGEQVETSQAAAKTISSTEPGQRVSIIVKRDGEKKRLRVPTTAASEPSHSASGSPSRDKAVVGVTLLTEYESPAEVTIQIDEIGGPSAGMMFALGIVDKLTKGDLTGGKFVAGTGTIDPSGKVGPIGGIAQKLAGARQDGAKIFLTPAKNCAEARQSVPEGLRLIKVRTLEDALSALRALKTGNGPVPGC